MGRDDSSDASESAQGEDRYSQVAAVALLYGDHQLSLARYLWLVKQHNFDLTEAIHAAGTIWKSSADASLFSGQDIAGKMCPQDGDTHTIAKIHGYDNASDIKLPAGLVTTLKQTDNFMRPIQKASVNELLDAFEWRNKSVESVPRARPTTFKTLDQPAFFDRKNPSFLVLNLDILSMFARHATPEGRWCGEALGRAADLAEFYAGITDRTLLDRFPKLKMCRFWTLALRDAQERAPKDRKTRRECPFRAYPPLVQDFLLKQIGLQRSESVKLENLLSTASVIDWDWIQCAARALKQSEEVEPIP